MIIKRNDLIKKIHTVWPDLLDAMPKATNIAIPDNAYWLLKRKDVEWILSDTWINKYGYIAEGFDCDDSAMLFHAFCIQERYKRMQEAGKTGWLPFAIGQAWGTRFQGKETGHAINIAISSDEGIIFMEPQNDKTWVADSNRDHVHFLRL